MRNVVTAENRSPVALTLAVIVVAVALAALVSTLVSVPTPHGPRRGMHARDLDTFLRVKVFVTTLNVVLLVALTTSYVSLYRSLPNQFTGSLVLVCLALLLYAVSANPLVTLMLGYPGGSSLGPFTYLPDLFATVATVVLLHQSFR
ncbi:hypothetical protein [Haladaptatus sp. NG-WS-4]